MSALGSQGRAGQSIARAVGRVGDPLAGEVTRWNGAHCD